MQYQKEQLVSPAAACFLYEAPELKISPIIMLEPLA